MEPPLWQRLWAKTDMKTGQTHPLICHLIDVAQVAWVMWNEVLPQGARRALAAPLKLEEKKAGRLLSFWAGGHDLGKACPAFQARYGPVRKDLQAAGLPFPPFPSLILHGTVSACTLPPLLEETGLDSSLALSVAKILGGHHGNWPVPREVQETKNKPSQIGGEAWDDLRRQLVRVLADHFRPPQVSQGSNRNEMNAFLTLLSGLVSVTDWIGSLQEYFPFAPLPLDLEAYFAQAEEQARRAMTELGWIGWRPPQKHKRFADLFPGTPTPRPMQQAVIQLADNLREPALVIIEAPTGSGKTEAALYLADHWARTLQQRGLYVAMPTMATSNQMFGRVRDFLAGRYPHDLVNVQLAHSQARWFQDVRELRLETTEEVADGTVAVMSWFLPRKRTLLAPFGVGTVDQTFLSVLETRHFFVRVFGLSHKTVIFDEVHAYDTYMSTIFCRLLRWLRAIGTSVILLSATLQGNRILRF